MPADKYKALGLPFTPLSASADGFDINDREYRLLSLAGLGYLSRKVAPAVLCAAITFSLDTLIYASGDILADTQPIASALAVSGGTGRVTQITLLDKDDQTAAGIDVVFLRSNTSLGTENAAPSISDLNAEEILGVVSIASGDWIDIGGAKLATKALTVPLEVTATTGTTIYVALITRGTPTQTASGIIGKFTIRQD